jgi:hypothetical protein
LAKIEVIRAEKKNRDKEEKERQAAEEIIKSFARKKDAKGGEEGRESEAGDRDFQIESALESAKQGIQRERGKTLKDEALRATEFEEVNSENEMMSKTPEVDESKLKTFDAYHDPIKSIFKPIEEDLLTDRSRPVREVIKTQYGVTYQEVEPWGGLIKLGGQSFYDSPKGKGMRMADLVRRQELEIASRRTPNMVPSLIETTSVGPTITSAEGTVR